ncbi:MAG: tetratricopeptide repeat protein, partial [Armatimonadetes bacterium]|nr:tetratricopeptide repeat protein [Armatimonadota bacterium]
LLGHLGGLTAAARLAREARADKVIAGEADKLQARLLVQMGDTARATGAARRAVEEAPDDPEAAALLAKVLAFDSGRASEALADAMAAHARWPRDPAVSAALGELLQADPKSLGVASRHLEDAAEADPRNADARYSLAVLGASEAGDPGTLWLAFLSLEPAVWRMANGSRSPTAAGGSGTSRPTVSACSSPSGSGSSSRSPTRAASAWPCR